MPKKPTPRLIPYGDFLVDGQIPEGYPDDLRVPNAPEAVERIRNLGWTGVNTMINAEELVKPSTPELIATYERGLFEATKELGEYCVGEGIEDIILIDRAARPVWVSLYEYLDLAYPDRMKPVIHFINPTTLDASTTAEVGLREIGAELFRDAAGEELKVSENTLLNEKDYPTLLFDICCHTGKTLTDAQALFQSLGFTDLRTGVYNYQPIKECSIVPDFMNETRSVGCNPYGPDASLKKSEESIYTTPSNLPIHAVARAKQREVHRDIIRRQFAAAQSA